MKIAVVTDSTAYLPQETVKKYGIRVVPIPFIIDGQVYNEGVDITTEEFYTKLRTSETFPSTSQPPVGELISLYQSLQDEGYDAVISIHLASTISGLCQTLYNLEEQLPDIQLMPYDSQITVMLMGNLVIEAARMAKAGANLDEIKIHLDELRKTIDEYFIVNDLQNLVRGGRLSNASAFIGNVLKIRPILTFDEKSHQIVAFEKVRSTKRALKRVEDLFSEAMSKIDYPVRILIIHANDEDAALKWQAKIQKKYPDCQVDISYFGPVIGTHLGEKALALAWMRDIDKQ
ncbi:DegV family protein [Ligilactobacillus sp. WILCCON 0076]|uniref:DegV family protein n=1 Tax=Ligilactobacillus ubinensis TaxID=2876789 RepID=A0A9X2FIM4_9LACO|nr:DegV family protein [Ligilactobacillus ubinensis]MCP0886134.1 DegV family protein [Ligilactobacillus ubinensis]